MTTAPTLDQVLTMAQQLSRPARAALIARFALTLAVETEEVSDDHESDDAWAAFFELSGEPTLTPLGQNSAEILSAMRR
jgi:hypothetical protein